MNQKNNMGNVVVVIIVVLAFILPGSTVFANGETFTVPDNQKTSDLRNIVESTIDTSGDTINLVPWTRGVIYVDDDRPPEWYDATHVHTIQEGVNNSTVGDTVYVYNGAYPEHVVVNKQVNLVGENKENVVVNGNNQDVFYIPNTVWNVNISNFTVTNGFNGIYIKSSNNNIITNCDANNNTLHGFQLWGSSYNKLTNCVSSHNGRYGYQGYGINLYLNANNNNITNCIAYENTNRGIWFERCKNIKLRGNTFYDNIYNFDFYGVDLADFIHDIDPSNTVNGKPIYYLYQQSDLTLDGAINHFGYLGLISCTNITAKNAEVNGILVINSTYSALSNITTHDSGYSGIRLRLGSHHNNLTDCDAYNNFMIGFEIRNTESSYNKFTNCDSYSNGDTGFWFDGSSYNEITNCKTYDQFYGFHFDFGSNYNIITGCDVNDTEYAIYLPGSSNNQIINCDVYNNVEGGIRIESSLSSYNHITDCNVYNTYYGIWATDGSSYNIITDCNVNDTFYGFYLPVSSHNTVTNCNAYDNYDGFWFAENSNTLINCNAYNNSDCGIIVGSAYNHFYHNNFIDNNWNYAWGTSNSWDNGYPSGGNYWSEYTGVDLYSGPNQDQPGGDGIGDTPYTIPPGGSGDIDLYPLMNPWDRTPPEITTIQATPEVQIPNEFVNITCTVTDNWDFVDTVMVSISGPDGFTLETTMNNEDEDNYYNEGSYTALGIYFYYILANDTSGNDATSTVHSFVITEFDNPTSAVDPLPLWENTIPFTIEAEAYDNIGVNNVTLWYQYSSNGTDWTSWMIYGIDEYAPWSWSFIGVDGYYRFYSIAVDDSGNIEDPPGVADALTGIDTTTPVTTAGLTGTMGGDNWYTSTVTVTLTATDALSGIESTWYQIDAGYWTLYSGTPFTVSSQGQHTVSFYSFDEAGNTEDTESISTKIDTIPPTTTHEFDGMMIDNVFISNVTVTLTATDESTRKAFSLFERIQMHLGLLVDTSGVDNTMYKINDGDWIIYSESFTVIEDGEYTISYYSEDNAGNMETIHEATLTIQKDLIPPVTTHTFGGMLGENNWYVSNVTVKLTATDDEAGVMSTLYKLDDGEWMEYIDPFSITEDGTHTLMYFSVDKLGNEETPKGPFNIGIDRTSPEITLVVEKIGLSKWRLTATVSDATSGVVEVVFSLDDEYLGEVTESPYEWLVCKQGLAQALAYDDAGNSRLSDTVPVPVEFDADCQSITDNQVISGSRSQSRFCNENLGVYLSR